MELSGCANHFDHRLDNHYHARCLKCARVFDVDMDYIPNFSERIRDTHGFSFSGYDLIFKGICTECKKLNNQTNNNIMKGNQNYEQDNEVHRNPD